MKQHQQTIKFAEHELNIYLDTLDNQWHVWLNTGSAEGELDGLCIAVADTFDQVVDKAGDVFTSALSTIMKAPAPGDAIFAEQES